MAESRKSGWSIALISVHGLVRGRDPELGRDADTGGQIKYVLELARALARAKEVASVDVLTRLIQDPRVGADYAEPVEEIGPGARIVRLPFGPRRYLRKEVLWPHLDSFLDSAIQYYRRVGDTPDVVHGHYADGGFVGAQLAQLLGVPFVFTGHSLGRVKRERLLAGGARGSAIESQYNISQRIEAEEIALENAAFVVASTHQEIDDQYARYENYRPRRMSVIPPGIDLTHFRPPRRGEPAPPIAARVNRFLEDPEKPLILAVSRPDPRKNVSALVEAYAGDETLREMANLALVLGNRDDVRTMEKGPRKVFVDLLGLIDRHDLYGKVAYPKQHRPEEVPDLFRYAARTHGVFINPALTEPFGLTLLEAAASGLPVVATRDGGPQDIIRNCRNGILVDPLDAAAIGDTLRALIGHRARWRRASRSGLRGVAAHYSWDGHVEKYLKKLRSAVGAHRPDVLATRSRSHLPGVERLLICDIDNTLIGDRPSLDVLVRVLHDHRGRLGWGVATGRRIESTLRVLKEWNLPQPDVLITAVGTEIHYGPRLVPERSWARQIDYRWKPEALLEALLGVPGLKLQPKTEQRRFKLSFFVDERRFPGMAEIRRRLRKRDLQAKAIYSHEAYLDLLPIRASKGQAVRFLGIRWGIPPECLLVAGDSGNDEEMLTGNTLGVVVGNYSPELEPLRGRHRVYFAERSHAAGILEGMEHYEFLKSRLPAGTEDAAATATRGGSLAV